jgi:hypothetical protein
MVVADDQFTYLAPLEQNFPNELIRCQSSQLPIEPEDNHVIKRGLGQNLQSLRAGGQQWRRRSRIDNLQRVGIEGHQHAGSSGVASSSGDLAQHRLMAQMDPVKRPYRNGAAVGQRR